MKEESLQKLKMELEKLKENISQKNRNITVIEELLEDSKVREFASLAKVDIQKLLKSKSYEKERERAIKNFISILSVTKDGTNDIYCKMSSSSPGYLKMNGEYYIDYNRHIFRNSIPCTRYVNLECFNDEKIVPDELSDGFESSHVVIYPDDYSLAREELVIHSLETNQKDAVKQIIKKYGKR